MMRSSKHSARSRQRQRRADARAAKRSEARASRRTLPTHRGVVFMLVLSGLLFSSVYPMKRYFAVRASIETLRGEERTLDRRTDALTIEKQRLQTDEAVEQLAREQLGMVKVGDVPFVMIEPGASPKAVARPPVAEETPPPESPSFWSRVWSTLKRTTRALR